MNIAFFLQISFFLFFIQISFVSLHVCKVTFKHSPSVALQLAPVADVFCVSAGARLTSLLFLGTGYQLLQATGLVFVALSHFPLPIKSCQLWESFWVGWGGEGWHMREIGGKSGQQVNHSRFQDLVRLWCLENHIPRALPFILALLCMPTWFGEKSIWIKRNTVSSGLWGL